jgi:hypothetical protein
VDGITVDMCLPPSNGDIDIKWIKFNAEAATAGFFRSDKR